MTSDSGVGFIARAVRRRFLTRFLSSIVRHNWANICYYLFRGRRRRVDNRKEAGSEAEGWCEMKILLWVTCLIAICQARYEPTSNYALKKVAGWTVYVNKSLLNEKKEVGGKVLRLLRVKLYDINRVVPKGALEELHKVPIWVEFEDKDVRCACYHESKEWLMEHGFNPDKAESVEVGDADNFLTWTLDQPSMLLHELAHAYHHRVLGHENPDVLAAYKRAAERKSYESVLRFSGRMERAYALNNAKEYFAELTEAYFGQNDFYPFVRAEVMRHDPEMYETLKKLWASPKEGEGAR